MTMTDEPTDLLARAQAAHARHRPQPVAHANGHSHTNGTARVADEGTPGQVLNYLQVKVGSELARLDSLPRPWHEGAGYDQTMFDVACVLIRCAVAPWFPGYDLHAAERDFHAHVPGDSWTQVNAPKKWESALGAVRRDGPGKRPDWYEGPSSEDSAAMEAKARAGSAESGDASPGDSTLPSLPRLEGVNDVTRVRLDLDPEGLWGRREALSVIQHFARAKSTSPWAVLGCLFARVACCVGPQVRVDTKISDGLSLNLAIALVGASGEGKDLAIDNSRLVFKPGDVEYDEFAANSGQGLIRAYAQAGPKGSREWVARSHLFCEAEIDSMESAAAQKSSSLLSELRKALMGGQLGGLIRGRDGVTLKRHSYRAAFIIGVQPERASTVLSKDQRDGGTSGRLLFFWVVDPWRVERENDLGEEGYIDLVEELEESMPEPIKWKLLEHCPEAHPENASKYDDFQPDGSMPWLPIMIPLWKPIVRQMRSKVGKRTENPIDKHMLITRVRIAALFALLDNRMSVTEEDWELSEYVMVHHFRARQYVFDVLEFEQRDASEKAARAQGIHAAIADDTVEQKRYERAWENIRQALARSSEPLTEGAIRRALTAKQRDYLEQILTQKLISREIVSAGLNRQESELYRLPDAL